MRKRLPLFLIISIVAAAALFILLVFSGNRTVTVSRTIGLKIKAEAAFRSIADTSAWRKWWPGQNGRPAADYVFDGVHFGPPVFYYNSVELNANDGRSESRGRLLIIPASMDSILLNWTDSIPESGPLLTRLTAGDKVEKRARQIDTILSSLQRFLADPVNVYGFRPVRETSRDSTLISVMFQSADSPGTALIYQKLDGLKAYINAQHAEIVNFPMMHIEGTPGAYRTMLAYPVDKMLPDSGPYKFKRFLPWKMVSAEVRGGDAAVRAGYRAFNQYIQDYSIPVMANGFAFLITDRSREPDSSKWVTRFSAPIP